MLFPQLILRFVGAINRRANNIIEPFFGNLKPDNYPYEISFSINKAAGLSSFPPLQRVKSLKLPEFGYSIK
jgi:hypothetical protein